MALDQITLTGAQLARVDSVFAAVRPNYAKQVDLIFTNGKADHRWRTSSPTVQGKTLEDLSVDDSKLRCSATCLVDLFATLKRSSEELSRLSRQSLVAPGALGRAPQRSATAVQANPDRFKRETILTIVHELGHVYQGWQIGKNFVRDYFDEMVSAHHRVRSEFEIENQPRMPSRDQIAGLTYSENQFEAGARDFASRWITAHSLEVNNGSFDFLLPMTVMRGVFPNWPGAFR